MARELALPANIDDICEGRDKAIALWLGLYDQYHATTAEAARLCIGGNIGLAGARRYADEDGLTCAFLQAGQNEQRDRLTGKITTTAARDHFASIATMEIDRRCWSTLMTNLQFEQLLDEQARREFHDGLRKAPIAFTPDNCAATFGHIWTNRRDIWLRGIVNTFAKLDRRFRSHDGFKLGHRLIIESALNAWGSWTRYDRRDTLRDVERVFLELDDKPPVGERQSIASQIEANRGDATPRLIEGDYFWVRIFGNGNLHLWFERKDLLRRVNLLLAEYYGEVIGDGYNDTEAEDAPSFHVTPAKDFGAFMTSDAVAAKVIEIASIRPGERILEPSAGKAALASPARAAGAQVTCVEVQPGFAHELRVLHRFADTIEADFLALDPAHFIAFDRVIMNPPFDRGRDCDHVSHAFTFLKPGGVLVAIMAARAEYGEDKRHKALHRMIEQCRPVYGRKVWHDLPPGSFAHAGTNVNTVILAIRKPG